MCKTQDHLPCPKFSRQPRAYKGTRGVDNESKTCDASARSRLKQRYDLKLQQIWRQSFRVTFSGAMPQVRLSST